MSMQRKTYQHRLVLSPSIIAKLRTVYLGILSRFEDEKASAADDVALKTTDFRELKKEMEDALESDQALQSKIKEARYHESLLHLIHQDNEVLSLPWGLTLEKYPLISLSKGIDELSSKSISYELPLKVLAFLTSPIGEDKKIYNNEKRSLLSATSLADPRFIQIDFTEDGSLKSLGDSLRKTNYDILYYSGHGDFANGVSYLETEKPVTGEPTSTSGDAFVSCLTRSQSIPRIVILSSCKTATGAKNESFRGVSQLLLQSGVSGIVAYAYSMFSDYANDFVFKLFHGLMDRHSFVEAFHKAQRQIYQTEYMHYGRGSRPDEESESSEREPSQWIIPQLFLSDSLKTLVDWGDAPKADTRLGIPTRVSSNQYFPFIRKQELMSLAGFINNRKAVSINGYGFSGKSSLAQYVVGRFSEMFSETVIVHLHTDHTIAHFENLLKSELRGDPLINIKKATKDYTTKGGHIIILIDNIEELLKCTREGVIPSPDLESLLELIFSIPSLSIVIVSQSKVLGVPFHHEIKLESLSIPEQSYIFRNSYLGDYVRRSFPKRHESTFYSSNPLDLILRNLFSNNGFGGIIGVYFAFEYLIEREPLNELFDDEEKFLIGHNKQISLSAKLFLSKGKLKDVFHLIDESEKAVFSCLRKFQLPVTNVALLLQGFKNPGLDKALLVLLNLGIVETYLDKFDEEVYCVNEMVKLVSSKFIDQYKSFNDKLAADYYWDYSLRHPIGTWKELEQAYHYYWLSNDWEKMNDSALALCRFHKANGSINEVLSICKGLYDKCQGEVQSEILELLHDNCQNVNLALAEKFGKELLKKVTSKIDLAATLARQGNILLKRGDLKEAKKQYHEALNHLQAIDENSNFNEAGTKTGILIAYGRTSKLLGEYEKSESMLLDALHLSQSVFGTDKNHRQFSYIHDNLAALYIELGKTALGIHHCKKAFEIASANYSHKVEVSALAKMGSVYSQAGNMKEADIQFQKAVYIAAKVDPLNYAITLNQQGVHFLRSERAQEALQILLAAKVSLKDTYDQELTISIMNNVAAAYGKIGMEEKAIVQLEECLLFSEKYNMPDLNFSVYGLLINSLVRLRKYDTALKYGFERTTLVENLMKNCDPLREKNLYCELFTSLGLIAQIYYHMEGFENFKVNAMSAFNLYFEKELRLFKFEWAQGFVGITVLWSHSPFMFHGDRVLNEALKLDEEFNLGYQDMLKEELEKLKNN